MIHLAFDLLAVASALAVSVFVMRWRLAEAGQRIETAGLGYAAALLSGAIIGGYGAGTLNLWLTEAPGIGRSVLGALAGSIAAIELFKSLRGIKGSTGLIFVPGFATSLMVGRWGCYFAGLDDHTHGTPSTLPWADDFGDGVLRHPVQLYESLAMALFLIVALALIGRRDPWFLRNGFYALTLYYAVQRFIWEFLKPYAQLLGPLNLFHLICAALVCYAIVMLGKPDERARP